MRGRAAARRWRVLFAVVLGLLALFVPFAGSGGASASCSAASPYSNAVAGTSGLAGYWRLGDQSGTTACDTVGVDPGSYQGGYTLGRTGPLAGDAGTAVAFNGTSGNVSVPSSSSLNVGDSLTIEAWVKRGATGSAQTIASKQTGAWALGFSSGNNLVLMQGTTKTIVSSKTTITDTTGWHYVAATKSGSTVHLYIDGVDQTGSVSNATLADNSSPLVIGENGTSSFLNGTLEEVGLYRGALSANQITNHYLLGKAACSATSSPYARGVAATSGLQAYWRLGETSGTTGCDSLEKNPGSYGGTVTLGKPGAIAGDSGTAVLFNGTSGNLSVPALSALNVGNTFSIEAWAKRGSTGGTTYQTIASKQTGAWALAFSSTNKLTLLQGSSTVIASSTTTVTDTTGWHYLVATKSGSTVHLYIDGHDVTGTVTNATLSDNALNLQLAENGTSAFFNGTLQEVALYNAALSSAQVSNHYSLGAIPNTTAPAITGTPTDGQTLTVSTGSWGGSPTSYAYQWQSCDTAGNNCTNISGATAQTYTLGASSVGSTLRAAVTATNSLASGTATSAQTPVVAALAPSNTAAPSVSGTPTDGQTLTASPGTWTGTSPSYAYQWRSCDSAGNNCSDIQGATAQTFQLTSATVGATVRVVVTASNSAGSASATSAQTAAVQGVAPSNTSLPSIAGTATDGQTLTAAHGSWSGSTPISYAYQWQSCDAAGNNCASITGATAQTVQLTSATVGSTIRVVVTASNSTGSAAATSAQTATVQGLAPSNSALPSISGAATDGQTLTASNGAWSGSTPLSYAYQWQTCDTAGNNCSNIPGATSQTRQLTSTDVGSTLRVVVIASNAAGSGSAASAQTSVVQAVPPTNSAPPSISGTATDGQTLTVAHGSWSGSTPLSYSYQWQTCDSAGNNCSNISGATGSTLALTSSNVGSTIRVIVTASNSAGSSAATSAQTSVVQGVGPSNSTLPSISGTATDGQTLAAASGTWSGSTPLSYAYQWQSCDSAGANCADIIGATAQAFTLASGNVGSTVRVVVTASNSTASASAASTATGVIQPLAPSDIAFPSVSGSTIDGQTLSAANGAWSGTTPLSYTYQWQHCDSSGANCTDIAGQTTSTYTLAAADVGSTLRVVVTATNAAGSASARSPVTAAIQALAPTNNSLPAVSGSAVDGQTLSASAGSWTGTSPSYAYQWQACDGSGANCADVAGQTSSTYQLRSGDVGSPVRVVVTASNAAGSALATSAVSSVVQALAPSNTGLPSVSGSTVDGQTLIATSGSWSGTSPSYAYQWQSCDATGANCANVAGQTGSGYALQPADVGSTLRVVVTASNAAGSATATSSASAVVQALAPSNTAPPVISGSAVDGQALSASVGSWVGTSPSYAYQWQSCDSQGANCADIQGQTTSTYALGGGDVGSTLRVRVTATNQAGTATAVSSQTAVVTASSGPTNTRLPSISGLARDGQTLSADPGSWESSALYFYYQWQRCDSQGQNCSDVPGETDPTYQLSDSDVGDTVEVVVFAVAEDGSSGVATSAPTAPVGAATLSNSTAPTVSGTAQSGQTLTAGAGTWSGASPVTYAYQWQDCSVADQSCNDISGATDPTYLATDNDVGREIQVVVTASAGDGSRVQASSVPTTAVAPIATSVPVNWEPPVIAGGTTQGQTLTTSDGTWNQPYTSASYQWQRCDANAANCVNIPGALAASYQLTAADAGATVRINVSVTTSTGISAAAASDPTDLISAAGAPQNTTAPSISGTALQGQILTASPGTWSGDGLTYTYQWQSCDPSGNNCAPISGATSDSYLLGAGDLQTTLRVAVLASGPSGRSRTLSAPTGVVGLAAPLASTAPPTISAEFASWGLQLNASSGSWSHSAPAISYDWESCDLSGENCSDTGVTQSYYQPGPQDNGTTLRVVVIGTDASGNTVSAESAQTPVLGANPAPSVTDAPALTGTPTAGQTLQVNPGTWNDAADGFGYQWQSCDTTGTNCADISGADASSYTLGAGDVGTTVRATITAGGYGGTASAQTPATAVVAQGSAPMATTSPVIEGDTIAGQPLYAGPGTWTDSQDSYSYQWENCGTEGANCYAIAGATTVSYTSTSADIGTRIAVAVTASGPGGTGQATSAATAPIVAQTPVNQTPPRVSAPYPIVNASLTLTPGQWQLSTGTKSYQWQRCDPSGQGCADIAGATSATSYTPTETDKGATIRVVETASGVGANARVPSQPTPLIGPDVPVATAAVSTAGYTMPRSYLSAQDATWNDNPAAEGFQWQSCDNSGQNCADIAGAITSAYSISDGDIGNTLRVIETANGSDGSGTSTSQPTSVVQAYGPPSLITAPSISGDATVGSTLQVNDGSWTTSPDLSVAWEQCDVSGQNCTSYQWPWWSQPGQLTADNLGLTYRAVVTASNPAGQMTAVSDPSTVVGNPPPPVNTTPPNITGSPVAGDVATADPGIWTDAYQWGYSYQWQICNSGGNECADIPSATNRTYSLDGGDVGNTLEVAVAADGPGGQSTITSAPSSVVSAAASATPTAPPTISGDPTDGSILTATSGTWSIAGVSYSYQWESCDSNGGNCAAVDGAQAATYPLGAGDVGTTLRVSVTTDNSGTQTTQISPPTAVVGAGAPLVNSASPAISGTPAQGETLSTDDGSWGAQTPDDATYQWQRCDTTASNCQDITGAISSTYEPTSADVGSTARVNVTASNAAGQATVPSAATSPIAPATATPSAQTIGVFLDANHNAGDSAIYTADVDGTIHQVPGACISANWSAVNRCNEVYAIALSPNGKQIVFADLEGLVLINADGTGRRILDPNLTYHNGWAPQWSPDGQSIIYSAPDNNIYRMAVNGPDAGQKTYLAQGFQPDYSPDGTKLVYESPTGTAITLADADGSNRQPIPMPQWMVTTSAPTFSPDGTSIAFQGEDPAANLNGPNDSGYHVYTMALDGTDLQQVDTNDLSDNVFAPSWSPNGQTIMYQRVSGLTSSDNTPTMMVAVNPDGSNGHQPFSIMATLGAYRQPTAPRIEVTGGLFSTPADDGTPVVDSTTDEPITVEANDIGSGVKTISLQDDSGTVIATATADCSAGCPSGFSANFSVPTSTLPSGDHTFHILATNGGGASSSQALNFDIQPDNAPGIDPVDDSTCYVDETDGLPTYCGSAGDITDGTDYSAAGGGDGAAFAAPRSASLVAPLGGTSPAADASTSSTSALQNNYGLSDQGWYGVDNTDRSQPAPFLSDPTYKQLGTGAPWVRLTVAWNTEDIKNNTVPYPQTRYRTGKLLYENLVATVQLALRENKTVMVSFNKCDVPDGYQSGKTEMQVQADCVKPLDPAQYAPAVTKFLKDPSLGGVIHWYTAWNEPNHRKGVNGPGQPTALDVGSQSGSTFEQHGALQLTHAEAKAHVTQREINTTCKSGSGIGCVPKYLKWRNSGAFAAGRYYNRLFAACQGQAPKCHVTAGDFSDIDFANLGKRQAHVPNDYIQQYRLGMGLPARSWAWHAYKDTGNSTNTNDTAGFPILKAFLRATQTAGKPVFLTEQDALYPEQSNGTVAQDQLDQGQSRVANLLNVASTLNNARIQRLFLYDWLPGTPDYALMNSLNHPRPAFTTFCTAVTGQTCPPGS